MSVNALIAQGVAPIGRDIPNIMNMNRENQRRNQLLDLETRRTESDERAYGDRQAEKQAAQAQALAADERQFMGNAVTILSQAASDPQRFMSARQQFLADPRTAGMLQKIGATPDQVTPENVLAVADQIRMNQGISAPEHSSSEMPSDVRTAQWYHGAPEDLRASFDMTKRALPQYNIRNIAGVDTMIDPRIMPGGAGQRGGQSGGGGGGGNALIGYGAPGPSAGGGRGGALSSLEAEAEAKRVLAEAQAAGAEGLRPTDEGGYAPVPGTKVDREQKETAEAARKRMTMIRMRGQTVLRDVKRGLELADKSGPAAGTIAEVPEHSSLMRRLAATNSPAYELKQHLDSVKSNISIDQLQMMREASPTGGALGQIPVRQQEFLMSVLGSLIPTLQPDVLRENLRQVYNIYLDTMYGDDQERAEAVADGRMSPTDAEQIARERQTLLRDAFGSGSDTPPRNKPQQAPRRVRVDAEGNVIGN